MATDTKGAEGAEAAVGMPQLDFSTFPNQIFWLVITLGAIYYVLDKIALPRIAGVLAERTGSITNDIAAAEELKGKAADAEAAYQQALSDARAEAQKIATATRAEIQADLDAATAKADAEISAKAAESQARISEIRDSALQSVEAVAKDTAAEIASAMGRPADTDAIARAVEARLKGAN